MDTPSMELRTGASTVVITSKHQSKQGFCSKSEIIPVLFIFNFDFAIANFLVHTSASR